MPMQIEQHGDGNRIIHDLPGIVPELDLTADPWNLTEGQASVVDGVDVTTAKGLRIAPPRQPVGATLSEFVTDTVTEAFGSQMNAPCPRRLADTIKQTIEVTGLDYDDTGHASGDYIIYDAAAGGTKFSGYTWQSGDHLIVYAAGVVTVNTIAEIAEKVDADTIRLAASIGADDAGGNVKVEIVHGRGYFRNVTGPTGGGTKQALTKTPDEYAVTGAWPEEVEGAYIVKNADGRVSATEIRLITGRATLDSTNDTIEWRLDWDTAWAAEDKFSILFSQVYDKRGIWATNGEVVALLQNGAWSRYIDLNASAYQGESWRMCLIAPHLLLLVNDTYAPRILRLDASTQTANTDPRDLTLAGMLTPRKPEAGDAGSDSESAGDDDGNTTKSWYMADKGSGGALSAGVYRVKVRAVNYIDYAESRFVDAYDDDDKDDKDITAVGNDALDIYNSPNDDEAPPMHERWTHIEVWRTQANGTAYFLERIIEINRIGANENGSGSAALVQEVPDNQVACTLSDANLAGQTQLTSADLSAGGPPPICKDAVNLNGVTLCFGAADNAAEDPTFDARIFSAEEAAYTNSNKYITLSGHFASYSFVSGDRAEVFSPSAAAGIYDIASKVGSNDIELSTAIGADYPVVHFCIRRARTILWPKIASDEDVWYSRTDKFAPESFPTRKLELSTIGDTYRMAVSSGRYCAVIMDEGVHLLYLDGTDLLKTTVATVGMGTPWGKSVTALGNFVFWGTKLGPRMMRTTPSADQDGNIGSIQFMPGAENVRQWFEDAYNDGDTVDAGVDTLHNCLRWRKSSDGNTYEAIQFSFITGKWAVLPDDSGVAYANSRYAGTTALPSSAMYSVAPDGNSFELNRVALTHAYDSDTAQGVTDGTYTVTTTSITKAGIFNTSMVGDIVRFRSDTASVNGVSRRILTATTDAITFNTVTGLAAGDEFIIGSARFKLRYAHLMGQGDPMNVKTVEDNLCIAQPGPRNLSGGGWPTTVPGHITMRAYRNFVPTAEDEDATEIGIFRDDDVSEKTVDRHGALECQGRAIEVEIECLDAKADVRIERTMVRIREDGDVLDDVKTDA
jgi:hypothetical protein